MVFFVKWIKRMTQTRMEKIERDMDDVMHEFAYIMKRKSTLNK